MQIITLLFELLSSWLASLPSMGDCEETKTLIFLYRMRAIATFKQNCMRLIVSLSIKPELDEKNGNLSHPAGIPNSLFSFSFRSFVVFRWGSNAIWFVREIYGAYLSFFTTMDHPIYCQWTLNIDCAGHDSKNSTAHRQTNSKSHIVLIPAYFILLFVSLSTQLNVKHNLISVRNLSY